jgi:hypothetical protein
MKLASWLGAATVAALLAGSALAATPTPAPRMKLGEAYGKKIAAMPNMSGVWQFTRGLMFDPDNAVNAPDPAGDDGGFAFGPQAGTYLKNIPYKPEYQKIYDDTIAQAKKGIITDPVGDCLAPHGMPREMGGAPGPIEIIVTPDQVWMIWDWFNATRRIYLDGRPHPSGDDLWPTSMGHSIGKWEGDVLAVDTVGMFAGIFDRTGPPHSAKLRMTERMRLVDPDTIEVQMTFDDPVAFTRPWKITRTLKRRPYNPLQLMGSYCEGGNRNAIVNGAQTAILATDTVPGVK